MRSSRTWTRTCSRRTCSRKAWTRRLRGTLRGQWRRRRERIRFGEMQGVTRETTNKHRKTNPRRLLRRVPTPPRNGKRSRSYEKSWTTLVWNFRKREPGFCSGSRGFLPWMTWKWKAPLLSPRKTRRARFGCRTSSPTPEATICKSATSRNSWRGTKRWRCSTKRL